MGWGTLRKLHRSCICTGFWGMAKTLRDSVMGEQSEKRAGTKTQPIKRVLKHKTSLTMLPWPAALIIGRSRHLGFYFLASVQVPDPQILVNGLCLWERGWGLRNESSFSPSLVFYSFFWKLLQGSQTSLGATLKTKKVFVLKICSYVCISFKNFIYILLN